MTGKTDQVAKIIMEMINERMSSNKAEDNLNYLRAYMPIARAVIDAITLPRS